MTSENHTSTNVGAELRKLHDKLYSAQRASGADQPRLIADARLLLSELMTWPGREQISCGHHPSMLLTSAETREPLYCEACDDKSGRRDAEQREVDLIKENRDLRAAIAAPQARPADALDAETVKKAADYDHLLPYLCKTCGGYGLLDRRSNEGPMDSELCPNCSHPADRIDFFLDELQRDGAEMLIMALHDEEGFPLDKKRAIAAFDKARVIRAAMAAAKIGAKRDKEG